MHFVRKNEEKFYCLSLGSGTKRTFERFERVGKKHQPGVPFGYFRLKDEQSPNGNRYAYKYAENARLHLVKALNKKGEELAVLNCYEGLRNCLEHCSIFSVGSMSVTYRRIVNHSPWLMQADLTPSFSIEPSHGTPTKYSWGNRTLLKKYQFDKNILDVRFAYPLWAGNLKRNTHLSRRC